MMKIHAETKAAESPARNIAWSQVCFTAGSKTILSNCWGEVKSGALCAIMGASGAGKSSMLNVLAGRVVPDGSPKVTGSVTVGGKHINPVAYRQRIAYVMQDDVLLQTATPREVLTFSANLRLPPGYSHKSRVDDVNNLLKELGIESSADTLIGGIAFKGISGGERKRVCVGVELIAKPEVLFLDEPTSGLDSFSAFNLVKTLKTVASGGSAVLCTIHQPSSEVFFQFDKVILMKAGRIMYQGPTADIVKSFSQCGFECPPTHNPSDFIMFVSQHYELDQLEGSGLFPPPPASASVLAVAASPRETAPADQTQHSFDTRPIKVVETQPFSRQLYYLFRRELLDAIRDKASLMARYGITLFLNVLFGIIFYRAGDRDDSNMENFGSHQGSITFLAINAMFMFANGVLLSFPISRNLFMREFSTGTYSTIPYFLSKGAVELALTVPQALLQVGLLYPTCKFQGNFLVITLCVILLGFCSASLGVTVSCVVKDVRAASEMSPLLFVPQILFAGFFVRSDQIPLWLRWPQYLCALKYGLNLLLEEEFGPGACRPGASVNCADMLTSNDVNLDLTGVYIGILVGVTVVLRGVGAVLLRRKALRGT